MLNFGDEELRRKLAADPDFTASFMRHIEPKAKRVTTAILIKCDDEFALSAMNKDIHFRAALIAHEGVLINFTMLKIEGKLFDIAYNFYDEQPNNLIVLIDLHNQDELLVHFVSPHEHIIAHTKNNLAPLADRQMSLSNKLPPWDEDTWRLALISFYLDWNSLEKLWDRLDKNHPENNLLSTRPIRAGDNPPAPVNWNMN